MEKKQKQTAKSKKAKNTMQKIKEATHKLKTREKTKD
jgi:hypothetical protein